MFCRIQTFIYPLINNNTDRTLDVVFAIFKGILFTITVSQKPEGVTRMQRLSTRQTESMRVTPLGFCLRVIMNKKPLNLEKTTANVLSV